MLSLVAGGSDLKNLLTWYKRLFMFLREYIFKIYSELILSIKREKVFFYYAFICILFLFLIGSIFIVPWGYDEGWNHSFTEYHYYHNDYYKISQRIYTDKADIIEKSKDKFIEKFKIVNNIENSYSYNFKNVYFFSIKYYIQLIIRVLISPDNYYFFRIFSLFSFLISIYFLIKILKKFNISKSGILLSINLMVLWSISSKEAMSLRTESIVMMLITIIIYLIFKSFEYNNLIILGIGFYLASFCCILHPNGFSALIIFIIAIIHYRKRIPFFINRIRNDKSYRINFIVFYLVSFLLLIFLLISNGIFLLNQLYQSVVSRDQYHSISIFKEYQRYFEMLVWSPYIFPFIIISITALFLIKNSSKDFMFIKICFLSILLFLFLLPVKWGHYLNIVASIVIIIFVFFLDNKPNKKYTNIMFSLIIFCFIVSDFIIKADNNEMLLKKINIKDKIILNNCIPTSMKNALNGRMNRIKKLKNINNKLEGKIVYAWPNLYPFFDKMYHIENTRDPIKSGAEYIIYLNELSEIELENKYNCDLNYFDCFIFQRKFFNVFEVNK